MLYKLDMSRNIAHELEVSDVPSATKKLLLGHSLVLFSAYIGLNRCAYRGSIASRLELEGR